MGGAADPSSGTVRNQAWKHNLSYRLVDYRFCVIRGDNFAVHAAKVLIKRDGTGPVDLCHDRLRAGHLLNGLLNALATAASASRRLVALLISCFWAGCATTAAAAAASWWIARCRVRIFVNEHFDLLLLVVGV